MEGAAGDRGGRLPSRRGPPAALGYGRSSLEVRAVRVHPSGAIHRLALKISAHTTRPSATPGCGMSTSYVCLFPGGGWGLFHLVSDQHHSGVLRDCGVHPAEHAPEEKLDTKCQSQRSVLEPQGGKHPRRYAGPRPAWQSGEVVV